jgi:hypothetical protein
VTVVNNRAYLPMRFSGTQIVDVSDPMAPALLGSMGTSDQTWRVAVSGNYAYLADGDGGVQVLDVTNPAAPVSTSEWITNSSALDIYLVGNIAYVATSAGGLEIIDFSNLLNPAGVSSYGVTRSASSVCVNNGKADLGVAEDGVQIINVNNPASVATVGSYEPFFAIQALAIVNETAIVSNGVGHSIEMVDVSDPSMPTELPSTIVALGGTPTDIAVKGINAYIACDVAGLKIVNISNPAAPSLRSTFNTSDNARAVAIEGNRATSQWITTGFRSSTSGIRTLRRCSVHMIRPDLHGALMSSMTSPM